MEIQDQADSERTKSQVGEDLGIVDGQKVLYGFHLDQHSSFDNQVGAVGSVDMDSTPDDPPGQLSMLVSPLRCIHIHSEINALARCPLTPLEK